jgi:hypothetical protein
MLGASGHRFEFQADALSLLALDSDSLIAVAKRENVQLTA